MATFILEAGMSTRVWRAMMALRTRVSISAIGSVMFMLRNLLAALPARLGHTGKLTAQRELAEADAADAKLAHIGAGPSTQVAAVVLLHLEPRLASRLHDHRDLGHCCPLQAESPGFGAHASRRFPVPFSRVLAGDHGRPTCSTMRRRPHVKRAVRSHGFSLVTLS